jgi:hypothetical protein
VENIELRCRAHNLHEARLFFGADVVRETRAWWGRLVPQRVGDVAGLRARCRDPTFAPRILQSRTARQDIQDAIVRPLRLQPRWFVVTRRGIRRRRPAAASRLVDSPVVSMMVESMA